ncbi:MAG: hypothetical protein MRERV_11c076, partial [Mycoplasmataceae bacterium RV_VA103A]
FSFSSNFFVKNFSAELVLLGRARNLETGWTSDSARIGSDWVETSLVVLAKALDLLTTKKPQIPNNKALRELTIIFQILEIDSMIFLFYGK